MESTDLDLNTELKNVGNTFFLNFTALIINPVNFFLPEDSPHN